MPLTATIRMDGALVFWGLPQFTNRTTLVANLKTAGFDMALKQRSGASVLQDAIEYGHAATTSLIIRPLAKGVKGFDVKREERGEDENITEFSCSYWLDGETETLRFKGNGALPVNVNAYFQMLRDTLRSQQMNLVLHAILQSLNAVRLSPKHGFNCYWVPEPARSQWAAVGEAVTAAAFDPAMSVASFYEMTHKFDSNGIKTVRDGLIREAEKEAEEIAAEVASGKLRVEALNNRVAAAKAMTDKVAVYEAILGETLDGLKQQLETARQAAAKAVLLVSVEKLRIENAKLAAKGAA